MSEALKVAQIFDLSQTIAASIFEGCIYPWEALPKIKKFILELGPTLPKNEYTEIAENVWVAIDAEVAPSASITGPCIIDHGAQVRHCAFIRGAVIIGAGAVAGNSSEFKNCILMNKAQTPHYNYIGDSILGVGAHLGAGAITSNLKSDKTNICVRTDSGRIETGLRKFGAMVGDHVEVGCGSVLNPGTVIGRNTRVYPLTSVRGFVPENGILKDAQTFALQEDR